VRGRSWLRRIVQYWTTISLGPIVLALLIAHLGTTFFGGSKQNLSTFGFIVQLLPSFILVSIAFGIVYKLMPNTPVHWTAALIGGIVGGSLWLLLNIFNAFNLSRVVSMSVIYGSVLATIPIFLVGLYFSWLIVLFGSQVAYAFQNRVVYVQTKKAETVNQRGREYAGVRTMVYLAQRFEQGQRPPTLQEIGEQLGVPSRLIVLVIQPLVEARLVLEVGTEAETAYAPARPLETITCHDIIETFRGGRQDLETRDDAARIPVCHEFNRIMDFERKAATGVTLKDLVVQLPEQESKVTDIAELHNRKQQV
jgi:membrane protein